MGRQTRQTRRAQQRRQTSRGRQGHTSGGINWSVIAGGGLVLVVAAVLVGFALGLGPSSSGSSAGTATIPPGTPVLGVGCNQMEGTAYHIHAHLAIFNKGKPVKITADSGHNYDQDCMFWLHSHDAIGIIHLEAPKKLTPPLSTWITIQNKTAQANQRVSLTTPSGLTRKVWLNLKPYSGDPAKIPIKAHYDITVEFGPPFVAPQKFNFKKYGI